jgi:uncharacterized membrane protein (UPF0127 family)
MTRIEKMKERDAARRSDADRRWQVTNVTRQVLLAAGVALADRGKTRRKGLLGRIGLSAGEGLWILPCEAIHTVGMKFSIDVLYLDERHRVLKAVRNVRPWRLSACLRAHSVLELAAGAIDESGTEIGDVLVIQCGSYHRAEAEGNRYLQRTTVYGG